MAIVINANDGTVTGISVGGLPDGIVDAGTLADDAVTNSKVAANAIAEAQLAANSVVTGKIEDGTIAAGDLASGVGGKVLQQVRVKHSSTSQLTNSGTSPTELTTSLRLAITPTAADSTLILECNAWFCSPNSGGIHYAKFYDVTNSTTFAEPPSNGSRQRVHWSMRVDPHDANDFHMMNMRVYASAANTTARTYTIYHGVESMTVEFLQSTLSSASGASNDIIFTITEVGA